MEIKCQVDTTGTVIDEVSFADQTTDMSYGRYANGTGNFQAMSITFNAENSLTTSISNPELERLALKAYPNPAEDSFQLEISGEVIKERLLSVYNMNGTLLYQNIIFESAKIDASDWASGMYIIRVDNVYLKMLIN